MCYWLSDGYFDFWSGMTSKKIVNAIPFTQHKRTLRKSLWSLCAWTANWILVGKERRTRRKTLGGRTRSNNKLDPHMTPGPGFYPGSQWREVTALTTLPSLLPWVTADVFVLFLVYRMGFWVLLPVLFCVSACGNHFDTPWILIYSPSL